MANVGVLPPNLEDVSRWAETGLRRAMLDETWQEPLRQYIAEHLDPVTRQLQGPVYESINLFSSVIGQLSTLYDEDPVIHHPPLSTAQQQWLAEVPWWSQSQACLQYTLGLRECLFKLEYYPASHLSDAALGFRLVTPDFVVAEALNSSPSVPALIEEARPRLNAKNRVVWTWDCWDIRNPAAPRFRILDASRKQDLTLEYLKPGDPLLGDWPYRWEDGRPFQPWVVYHAQDTGKLWQPYRFKSLVNATMNSGLLEHYLLHVIRDCSYQQRYTLDAEPVGMSQAGEGSAARGHLVSNPAIVHSFQSRGDRKGQLGQWSAPADPRAVMETMDDWESRVLVALGLTPSDAQRSEKGQSGYAIELRQDVKRQVAHRTLPMVRRADLERLRKCLQMANRFLGMGLPLEGWSIDYPSAPQQGSQWLAEGDKEALSMGLMSVIEVYRRQYPQASEKEAIQAIMRNKAINIRLLGGGGAHGSDTADRAGPGRGTDSSQPDLVSEQPGSSGSTSTDRPGGPDAGT